MFQAEKFCDVKYGTTLATIDTDADMNHTLQFLRDNAVPQGYIWIGLYEGRETNYHWAWSDGTPVLSLITI